MRSIDISLVRMRSIDVSLVRMRSIDVSLVRMRSIDISPLRMRSTVSVTMCKFNNTYSVHLCSNYLWMMRVAR